MIPTSLRWFVLLFFAAFALAGCSTGAPRDQVVLTVWGTLGGQESYGLGVQARLFEHEHPGVRVRMLTITGGMSRQKLMTAIVGGAPPDVVVQDRFTIADWARRGAFRPLDELIARDKTTKADCPTPDQYYPAAWNEAMFEGKVYGIPSVVDDRLLYYNKDAFARSAPALRAAGLDPNRPPRTWSELLAYSKALTVFGKGGTLKQAGFIPNFGDSALYLYAFQNDASFMSPDGKTCTLDTPASEQALDFMKAGFDVVGGYEKAQVFQGGLLGGSDNPILTGQIAMKVDGNWTLKDLVRYGPDANIATAPAPVPDDRYYHRGRFAKDKDTFITWSGGFAWCIPNGARHTELAWELVKFLSSNRGRMAQIDGQARFERFEGRLYIPPQSAQIETNEWIYRKYKPPIPTYAAIQKMHMQMMSHGRYRPATFVGQVLWDEHQTALEQACLGRATVGQALVAGQKRVQSVLDEAEAETRHPVFSLFWPFVVLAVGLVGLVATGYVRGRRSLKSRMAVVEARWGFLFISPWIVGFLVFVLGPMLASLMLSFTQYDVLSPPRWVGAGNYVTMMTDDRAHIVKALYNSAYLSFIGVPLGIVTGLSIALLLNTGVRGMTAYRTIFYMPSIVPGIATAVLWAWLLAGNPEYGLVNALWTSTITKWFGWAAPGWYMAEAWAKPTIILMGLWGAGGGMVLWLAGLRGVPKQLYEAAEIDGASPSRRLRSITLPHISPLIFFNVVVGFIGSLQEFDRAYVITDSGHGYGPADSLLVPVYYLFNNAFAYFRMGYAGALAWGLFAIIVGLTFLQFKAAPKWVHYEGDA